MGKFGKPVQTSSVPTALAHYLVGLTTIFFSAYLADTSTITTSNAASGHRTSPIEAFTNKEAESGMEVTSSKMAHLRNSTKTAAFPAATL